MRHEDRGQRAPAREAQGGYPPLRARGAALARRRGPALGGYRVRISEGLLLAIIVAVCLLALPLASAVILGSSRKQMPDLMAEENDEEADERVTREAEIRQLLEGKRYRQIERGEEPIDVESELRRILAEDGRGL